jgi:hypothetical protein
LRAGGKVFRPHEKNERASVKGANQNDWLKKQQQQASSADVTKEQSQSPPQPNEDEDDHEVVSLARSDKVPVHWHWGLSSVPEDGLTQIHPVSCVSLVTLFSAHYRFSTRSVRCP